MAEEVEDTAERAVRGPAKDVATVPLGKVGARSALERRSRGRGACLRRRGGLGPAAAEGGSRELGGRGGSVLVEVVGQGGLVLFSDEHANAASHVGDDELCEGGYESGSL